MPRLGNWPSLAFVFLVLVPVLIAGALPAQAVNVADDFRITLAQTDADDETDVSVQQLGYTHYFEPLRSESDLPFNFEFFLSHPSSIAFNIARLDQDSVEVEDVNIDADLIFDIEHLVGQWFFVERMGLLFSLERINSTLNGVETGTGPLSGLEFSQLNSQTIMVPAVGFQHYYTDSGAWSVQYYYTDVRTDVLVGLDILGTEDFDTAFDVTDEYSGGRAEWTHIWGNEFRASANVFANVASTPPSQGIFPSPTSKLPGTFFKNEGGGAEFEWAFMRGQSAQVSYALNKSDDTDDEKTTYGAAYTIYFSRKKTLLFYYGRTENELDLGGSDTETVDSDEFQVSFRFAR